MSQILLCTIERPNLKSNAQINIYAFHSRKGSFDSLFHPYLSLSFAHWTCIPSGLRLQATHMQQQQTKGMQEKLMKCTKIPWAKMCHCRSTSNSKGWWWRPDCGVHHARRHAPKVIVARMVANATPNHAPKAMVAGDSGKNHAWATHPPIQIVHCQMKTTLLSTSKQGKTLSPERCFKTLLAIGPPQMYKSQKHHHPPSSTTENSSHSIINIHPYIKFGCAPVLLAPSFYMSRVLIHE